MLKPVYIVAASRAQQSGWYIANESGEVLPNGHAFADKAECYKAIAGLAR